MKKIYMILFLLNWFVSASGQAGNLNPAFGNGGYTTSRFFEGQYSEFYAVATQTDGKLVAVGHTFNDENADFAIARYNPDGSLDATFSDDGKQTTDLGAEEVAYNVVIQKDGKIIVSGYGYVGSVRKSLVARYNIDGSLDSTFANEGILFSLVGSQSDYDYSVALQKDNKIVLGGYTDYFGNLDFLVMRFSSNGTLDSTFSGDGIQITDFGRSGVADVCRAIAIQEDGKIVAVGASLQGVAIARYSEDGSLDNSFSEDGRQTTNSNGEYSSVAIQTDQKIIVGGFSLSDRGFALLRYNPDGSLDSTFSEDGMITTLMGIDDRATAVLLQSDGKIIAAGHRSIGLSAPVEDFAIARYNADGALDSTFSDDGTQITDFSEFDIVHGAAISGNQLYVVGWLSATPRIIGVIANYDLGEVAEAQIWYRDADGDDYGNATLFTTAPAPPAGYVADKTDCNDNNSLIHPNAVEVCGDGIDNDCDGAVDEGCGKSVTSFTLVNAATDKDVQELKDGAQINLAAIRGERINIRANTDGTAGSAVMKLSGSQVRSQTENIAPYALFGGSENNYGSWTPKAGTYTLTATPYSEAKGKGTAGIPLTITFTFVEELTLSHFTLINSRANVSISKLEDGAVIDLAAHPEINVRVNQGIGFTESVRFGLNGNVNYKVENSIPYAIASDNKGYYASWNIAPGKYTITATPYTKNGAIGFAGTPLEISITVIDSRQQQSSVVQNSIAQPELLTTESLILNTYPNPTPGSSVATFKVHRNTKVTLALLDENGKLLQMVYSGSADAGIKHTKHLVLSGLASGTYILRLTTGDGTITSNKTIKQ